MTDEKRCVFCKKKLTDKDKMGTCLRCKITGVDAGKKVGKGVLKVGAGLYMLTQFYTNIKGDGDGNA